VTDVDLIMSYWAGEAIAHTIVSFGFDNGARLAFSIETRNGDAWLISDIYLDGAISEVATRRAEFAAILKNDGIDGLIAALNRKADILTATTAKAS
jgi:ABC-type transporter MlaC component